MALALDPVRSGVRALGAIRRPSARITLLATTRSLACVLILGVCFTSGTTGLPAVKERLGSPLPILASARTAVAGVGIQRDGTIAMSVSPSLVHYQGADMLAFLYLHELGHVRLGHLRPHDPRRWNAMISSIIRTASWQMEYDADEWAARQALRHGYDPVLGMTQLFARYGDGGGLTHPLDRARVGRVRRLVSPAP